MKTLAFRIAFTLAFALVSGTVTVMLAGPAQAAAPKAATKAEPKKADAKGSADLEEVSDAAFGYSIRIPKGSKVLQKDEYGHTYSLPLPGGNEFNVSLNKVQAASLDDAVNTATMMGTKEIEKKDAGDYFLVVKAAQFGTQEVHVYRKGAELGAKCAGPEKEKAKLVEICTSLQKK